MQNACQPPCASVNPVFASSYHDRAAESGGGLAEFSTMLAEMTQLRACFYPPQLPSYSLSYNTISGSLTCSDG